MHELTREQARRIAVRAQLLSSPRPKDALAVLEHLTSVQVDLTDHVAPSPDIVWWSRLGAAYRPSMVDDLFERGDAVELFLRIIPAADLPLYSARLRAWPGTVPEPTFRHRLEQWLRANKAARTETLAHLRSEGPTRARDLPDNFAEPWTSTGWTNNKNRQKLVDILEARGEIAVAGREGRERLWDLAERVWPDHEPVPLEEADAELGRRRLAAWGIARAKGVKLPTESNDVGDVGEVATVEGTRGTWRVDPQYLSGPFRGRAAILSPLDRLIFDRKRMEEIFTFDYALEMYKPAAVRLWGYWAMPLLYGDQLVGKLDAQADHDAGELVVAAIHEDEPFTKPMRDAFAREIDGLARMLGLTARLP